MLMIILCVLLACLAFLAISLLKIYTHVPKIELKRRARQGDDFAQLLYSAAAYGASTQVLLWFFIGLAGAGFFVLVSTILPSWLALILALSVIWVGFAWLPNTHTSVVGRTVARYITPGFAWLLSQLYPVLDKIAHWFARYGRISLHTGLYQKEDLVELLNKQKNQHDNRISDDEMHTVAGALTYGDKMVRDVLVPWRMIKSVGTTDAIGPHLMDELHSSGHSRFPVYQDKPDNIVGMLYARDLINANSGGQVKDHMKKRVLYIHEDQTLNQALRAFLKTHFHLFIVVNSFEEKVGIISLEDVLEQIIGKQVVDEFDKHDDLREVAAHQAKVDHQTQDEPEPHQEESLSQQTDSTK